MTLLRHWTTGLLSRTQIAFSFDWEVRIAYPQSDKKLALWRRKRLLIGAEQAALLGNVGTVKSPEIR